MLDLGFMVSARLRSVASESFAHFILKILALAGGLDPCHSAPELAQRQYLYFCTSKASRSVFVLLYQ